VTGPGRPAIGPLVKTHVPQAIDDKLRAEARRQSIPIAAMLRRILTERYEGKG